MCKVANIHTQKEENKQTQISNVSVILSKIIDHLSENQNHVSVTGWHWWVVKKLHLVIHQLSQILKWILCFTEQFRVVHLRSPGSSCQSWDQRMEQFLEKSLGSSFNILKKEPAVQNLRLPSLAVNRYKPIRPVCGTSTNHEPELDVSRQHFKRKSRAQFLSDSDKFNPLPRNGPFVHPKKRNKCTL